MAPFQAGNPTGDTAAAGSPSGDTAGGATEAGSPSADTALQVDLPEILWFALSQAGNPSGDTAAAGRPSADTAQGISAHPYRPDAVPSLLSLVSRCSSWYGRII